MQTHLHACQCLCVSLIVPGREWQREWTAKITLCVWETLLYLNEWPALWSVPSLPLSGRKEVTGFIQDTHVAVIAARPRTKNKHKLHLWISVEFTSAPHKESASKHTERTQDHCDQRYKTTVTVNLSIVLVIVLRCSHRRIKPNFLGITQYNVYFGIKCQAKSTITDICGCFFPILKTRQWSRFIVSYFTRLTHLSGIYCSTTDGRN